METSSFWILADAMESDAVRARPVGHERETAMAAAMGISSSAARLRFERQQGRRFRDVVGTGWAFLFLMSDQLRALLSDSKITGWRSFPITLVDHGKPVSGYTGLAVIGRSGPLDLEKHERVVKASVDGRYQMVWARGLWFDIKTWDGNDVFVPDGTSTIIVTERTAALLRQAKVSNVSLERMSEIERLIGRA